MSEELILCPICNHPISNHLINNEVGCCEILSRNPNNWCDCHVTQETFNLASERDTIRRELDEERIGTDKQRLVIMDLSAKLQKAKDVIMTLTHHLPDSEHDDGDESWQWCWDELSGRAQDKVKTARRYAEVYLDKEQDE